MQPQEIDDLEVVGNEVHSFNALTGDQCHDGWKQGDFEILVKKDRATLNRIYGGIMQLRKLYISQYVSAEIYERELLIHLDEISLFVGTDVRTLDEANDIFKFFILSDDNRNNSSEVSNSSRAAGFFSLLNIVIFMGVLTTVLGLMLIFGQYIEPLLTVIYSLPPAFRIAIVYTLTFSVSAALLLSKLMQTFLRPYLAFGCAIAIGLAYSYHIGCVLTGDEKFLLYAILTLPIDILWTCMALYYQTKLIGFISIAALQMMLDMFFVSFLHQDEYSSLITSLIIVIMYTTGLFYSNNNNESYNLNGNEYNQLENEATHSTTRHVITIYSHLQLFDIGVTYYSFLIMNYTLLVMSSRFYTPQSLLGYIITNLVTLTINLLSVYLSHAIPKYFENYGFLGCLFTIFFIFQKWFQIEADMSLRVFGCGVLLLGVASYFRTFPRLFLFSNNIAV